MKRKYNIPDIAINKPQSVLAGKTSRRNFLKYSTLSAGSFVLLNACNKNGVKTMLPYFSDPNKSKPFEKQNIASCCTACVAACPIVVKTLENRPIKIEGNPGFQLTAGGTCAMGQIAVADLYRDDRVKVASKEGNTISEEDALASVKEILERKKGNKNAWFVTSISNSPSETSLILDFCSQYGLKPLFYQKYGQSARLDAHEHCFGKRVNPHFNINNARVILSFQDDFLSTGFSPVQHTAQFANATDCTLIQFESLISTTGIKANERIKTSLADTAPLMLALYNLLAKHAGKPRLAIAEKKYEIKIRPFAQLLLDNFGRSLVVCGINDLYLQKLAIAINALLGSYGRTLDLDKTAFTNESPESTLSGFLSDLENSNIDSALVYNANPVADFDIEEIFSKIPHTTGFFTYSNNTSQRCKTVIPVSHFLESYFDQQQSRGYVSLSQPVVKPLFATQQLATHLLTLSEKKYSFKALIKSRWKKKFNREIGHDDFEFFWKNIRQKGFVRLPVKSLRQYKPSLDIKNIGKEIIHLSDSLGNQVVLFQSSQLKVSYYPAHPYLRELPNGVGGFSWQSIATVSSRFAQINKLKNGDQMEMLINEKKIMLPVLIMEGQADADIGIAGGYDNSPILPFITGKPRMPFYDYTGVKKTGRKIDFPHAAYGSERMDFSQAVGKPGKEKEESEILFRNKREFYPHHWAMAIDLKKCTACLNCVVSCQLENNIPVVGEKNAINQREMHWLKFHYFRKKEKYSFIPVSCQQCDHASCEPVCPVGATSSSHEGINQQSFQRCIGARFCEANCPYEARRFNYDSYFENRVENKVMTSAFGRMTLNPEVSLRERGTMEKCTFCIHRIQEAKYIAKKEDRELKDGDIKTACQQSCPAGAILFGDLNDPVSVISLALQQRPSFRLLEKTRNEPSVYYFPDTNKNTDF